MGGLDGLRVLVVHDWLMSWAGSERCLEQILEVVPKADLVVGVVDRSLRDRNSVTRRARETWLARVPGVRTAHRWFLPIEALAFRTLSTRGYDLVISSSHAFAKTARVSAGTRHLCYCYTPPRYLWDLYDEHRRHAGATARLALMFGAPALRWVDRRSAAGVHQFVAISKAVAQRVARWYGRDSTVVYPPVAGKPGPPAVSRQSFLLTLGRLVPYKRVDLAIDAAERLGVRLVVAGDGPDRARLERLAGRCTEFVGEVSEADAGRLMSECAAFVFCADEDFGIAPVEANAHGAPVVAYAKGGVLETMVAGKTAEFFDEQHVDAVLPAIERVLSRQWDEPAIRANVQRFSPERFREEFRQVVERVIEGRACHVGDLRPAPVTERDLA